MRLHKKGLSIGDVPYVAMSLVVVAVVFGLGASVLNTMRDAGDNIGLSSATDNNTVTNPSTATYFSDYDEKGNAATLCTITSVENATNRVTVVGAPNRTTSGAGGCYLNVSSTWKNVIVVYSKQFQTYSYAYNQTDLGLQSQESFSSWQSTWVTVLAASIVVGLLGYYLMRN